VTPLPIPDLDVLRAEVTAALAPVADARSLGLELTMRMLRNPHEPVFWVYELLGQVKRTRPAQEAGLALDMVEAMVTRPTCWPARPAAAPSCAGCGRQVAQVLRHVPDRSALAQAGRGECRLIPAALP
jgi:hypothetical protein